MSKVVNIDNIENGMILAESIVNSSGQVLLGSGVEITQKHKRYFQMWGISSVIIEGDDDEYEINFDAEVIEAAEKKLLERMKWEPRNANEKDLINLGIINIANKLNYK